MVAAGTVRLDKEPSASNLLGEQAGAVDTQRLLLRGGSLSIPKFSVTKKCIYECLISKQRGYSIYIVLC